MLRQSGCWGSGVEGASIEVHVAAHQCTSWQLGGATVFSASRPDAAGVSSPSAGAGRQHRTASAGQVSPSRVSHSQHLWRDKGGRQRKVSSEEAKGQKTSEVERQKTSEEEKVR